MSCRRSEATPEGLQQIVKNVEAGSYDAKPSRVFSFEQIAEAHSAMERGDALGKLVIAG